MIDKWIVHTRSSRSFDDVKRMIEVLQAKSLGPCLFFLPDEWLIAQGLDPNDYPVVDGHPGYRVVEAK